LSTVTPQFPPIGAPKLAVGDHWQYKITDNLRLGLVTMQDATVVSLNAGTATSRLVYNDQDGRREATEEIDANGGMVSGALKGQETRRFQTPIKLYEFPLEQGKTWRQTVATISPDTQLPAQILVYGTVQGQTTVTVPAGAFNDLPLPHHPARRRPVLRTRTTGRFVWYSPDMKVGARTSATPTTFSWRRHRLVRHREHTTRELIIISARTQGPLIRGGGAARVAARSSC
jgi:hypothetical protein